jgi:hypothetical protein
VEVAVTISSKVLTADHVAKHPAPRVAEVRAQDATPIPEGFVALGHRALAQRLGCCPRTARYRIEKLLALQGRDGALQVVRLPVPIGSGAVRRALHVLWPVSTPASAAA